EPACSRVADLCCHSELLAQLQVVERQPGFNDLSAIQVVHGHSCERDAPSGRCDSLKFALVRAMDRPTSGDGVALGDDLVNGVVQIREGGVEHPYDILRGSPIERYGNTGQMKPIFGAEQLISDSDVPFVPEFLVPPALN